MNPRLVEDLQAVMAVIQRRADALGLTSSDIEGILARAQPLILSDLGAYLSRDPATGGEEDIVIGRYNGFKALVIYRIAHQLHRLADAPGVAKAQAVAIKGQARELSQTALVQTGVDINPGAEIGQRCVIDHSHGVVIGETVVAGDEFYCVQGVILGADGIADNVSGRRHPKIGNKVQMGAFSSVNGPVEIGDNVLIGPHIRVHRSIPSDSKIFKRQELIIQRGGMAGSKIEVHGIEVIRASAGELRVFGANLDGLDVAVIYVPTGEPHWALSLFVLSRSPTEIVLRLVMKADFDANSVGLKVERDSDWVLFFGHLALDRVLEAIKRAA